MRRLEVRYRKSAANDLTEIGFYLQEQGASRAVARAYLERLRGTCRRIGDAPEGGRKRDDLLPGLRMWTFERRAVITYQIDERGVRIINIFYGGRDIEAFYRKRAGQDGATP